MKFEKFFKKLCKGKNKKFLAQERKMRKKDK